MGHTDRGGMHVEKEQKLYAKFVISLQTKSWLSNDCCRRKIS